ncbi:MAG: tRNA preQ1(34) S-adenosylmethionine ribosyltransferase-isomerase QueA [Candidatus Epulonipiscioides saccharophilum]|nr:MAG: tRNA preQ1(34) S-adenosylmethionine ribosyltransferase-isomerase QueA [Epulopiscium sp. AS2M-Bin001]
MQTSDFKFELPEELIAQIPLEDRSESRLMVLNREQQTIEHKHFYDIATYLEAGDCLVLNDTKVIPARLFGRKQTGGKIEILILRRREKDIFETLVKPGKNAKIGDKLVFGEGLLNAEVIDKTEEGNRIIKFEYEGIWEEILEKLGEMPLPPYITQKLANKNRYQTVYAKNEGSAAAPTAGLHFTKELLERLKAKGVRIAYVTLHVGLGTFRPVKVENIKEHKMHSEYYYLDETNAKIINQAKQNGKSIVAVGTTSTRVLESIASEKGRIEACSGDTEIFIKPGYNFKVVDKLITNFHLPESTLIMLVSALYDREKVLEAYKVAVNEHYRFFSFGDAMLII